MNRQGKKYAVEREQDAKPQVVDGALVFASGKTYLKDPKSGSHIRVNGPIEFGGEKFYVIAKGRRAGQHVRVSA